MTTGTIKKWLPCALYDFAGIEKWLDGMAAQGYALEKWPGFFSLGRVTFRSAPSAPRARYRLDPIGKAEQPEDRREDYRELGWDYVTRIGDLYAVYRCDDPDAPDLYTDTQSLAWAMKRMIGKQWRSAAVFLLYLLILHASGLVTLFTEPYALVLDLILDFDLFAPFYAVYIPLFLVFLAKAVYQNIRLIKIRKSLLQGDAPNPMGRSRACTWDQLALWLFFLFALAYLLLYWPRASGRQNQYLDGGPENWHFPHVALTETLPEGARLENPSKWEQYCLGHSSASWLAPEQYDTSQDSLVLLPGGTTLDSDLGLEYIRARSSGLAEAVLRGLVARQRSYLARDEWTQEALEVPGLDEAVSITYVPYDGATPRTFYAGRLGDQVFALTCSGAADPEAALELMVDRLPADG